MTFTRPTAIRLIALLFPILFTGCSWPGWLIVFNHSTQERFRVVLQLTAGPGDSRREAAAYAAEMLEGLEIAALDANDEPDSDLSWQETQLQPFATDETRGTVTLEVPPRTALKVMLKSCCNGYRGGRIWFESLKVVDMANLTRLQIREEYFADLFVELDKGHRVLVLRDKFP